MKTKKLSEEILNKIKELQQKSAGVVKELGEIELNKIILEERKNLVKDILKEINVEQDKVLAEIKEKYGEVEINLSTGEYLPLTNQSQLN